MKPYISSIFFQCFANDCFHKCDDFSRAQINCAKVMFSDMSVCHGVGGVPGVGVASCFLALCVTPPPMEILTDVV